MTKTKMTYQGLSRPFQGRMMMEDALPRSFDEFIAAVKDSCEGHAQRKNYTDGGVDGDNQLLRFLVGLGIHDAHSIGEIIYKAVEYIKAPPATRKVLLEKIAGWCWVMWRELDAEPSAHDKLRQLLHERAEIQTQVAAD